MTLIHRAAWLLRDPSGLVDPVRHFHRSELRQTVSLLDVELETHGFKTCAQLLMVSGVSVPGVFKTFLFENQQRLMQGI